VPKKKLTLQDRIKQEIAEYPPGYNAHEDQLANAWDHAESVNKLLALLKEVHDTSAPVPDALHDYRNKHILKAVKSKMHK
jgi:hypothetical protein